MKHQTVLEAVRSMLRRGLTAEETAILLQAMEGSRREFGDPACASSGGITIPGERRVSPDGVALIKRFEGCARRRDDGRFQAYPDPGTGGAPWTIGWGATGRDIGPKTVWSAAQCDARLIEDIVRHACDVDRALGNAETTQHQFDALTSFHYNTGAIGRATLTRRHISADYADARRQFARWNRAGRRVLKGLVRRRSAEAALYSGD